MNILNSEDTSSFTSVCGKFIFVVKVDFLKWCKRWGIDPSQEDVYDLMTKHSLKGFLHNTSGPAITYLETGKLAYFVDGKELLDGDKIINNINFNNKLLETIGEE